MGKVDENIAGLITTDISNLMAVFNYALNSNPEIDIFFKEMATARMSGLAGPKDVKEILDKVMGAVEVIRKAKDVILNLESADKGE